MVDESMTIALVSDVFVGPDAGARLRDRLRQAHELGARLALLPEIPCGPWAPATDRARDEDAEEPGGPRHRLQAEAARDIGIGLVGGAIVRDPETGERYNTALVFDAEGRLTASYEKLHLPEEPGFWETSHYRPGRRPPAVVTGFPLRFGVQICSDINRPEGCHLLGALGAEAILAPRATEAATYERWRIVFQANALTSTAYVLSVNRPGPEDGVLLGGPSIAVAPNGTILLETTDPVAVVSLDPARVRAARRAYPGYLPVRSDLYADAWKEVDRHAR